MAIGKLGKGQKTCPDCGKFVPEIALRCKHCDYNFATPEFFAQKRQEALVRKEKGLLGGAWLSTALSFFPIFTEVLWFLRFAGLVSSFVLATILLRSDDRTLKINGGVILALSVVRVILVVLVAIGLIGHHW